MLVFEFNVTVSGLAVVPLDHPLKLYPELGVAVTLTCVPALKLPNAGATLPPSPADDVRLYLGVILFGIVPGSCESSLAHVKSNSRNIEINFVTGKDEFGVNNGVVDVGLLKKFIENANNLSGDSLKSSKVFDLWVESKNLEEEFAKKRGTVVYESTLFTDVIRNYVSSRTTNN